MGFAQRQARWRAGRRLGNPAVQPHGRSALAETSLDRLLGGDEVEILGIDDEQARMHALRFGMAEGACARCVTRIPAGPIVMRSGRQEIAIGRGLARRIRVRRIGGCGECERFGQDGR